MDEVKRYGILPERMTAYRHLLGAGTIAEIHELAGDLYERAHELVAA